MSTADFLVLFRWAYKQEGLDKTIDRRAEAAVDRLCGPNWQWWDFGEGTSDPVFSLVDFDEGGSTTTYSGDPDLDSGDSTTVT